MSRNSGVYMYKNFLKPILTIVSVYIVGFIGVIADIDQLFRFNLIVLIKEHSPISYILIIAASLLLYLILVVIEFAKTNTSQQKTNPDSNLGQLIKTHNVNNSTIIQIKKDKGDYNG